MTSRAPMSTRRWLASWLVAIVLVVVLGALAGFAVGYFVLPYYSPGSKSVELTVISQSGPYADNGGILAAPSLVDLTTLATGATRRPERCSVATCWPNASVPKSSLLIALPTPVPCFRHALSADVSTGNALEIQIVAGASECPPGALALAPPSYWLLAVPLDGLPTKAISVVVFTRNLPLWSDADRNSPVLSTMVDLRRPMGIAGGAITATDVRATIDAARRDAEQQRHSGFTGIVGLGLFRWPAGESLSAGSSARSGSCAAPPDDPSGEVWGSFVTLHDYKTTFDYRSEGGATVFCGSHPY
jgi:hypothetical protein